MIDWKNINHHTPSFNSNVILTVDGRVQPNSFTFRKGGLLSENSPDYFEPSSKHKSTEKITKGNIDSWEYC